MWLWVDEEEEINDKMNEKEEEKETQRYQTRIHGGRSRKRFTAGNAGDHNEKDKYEKLLKIGHCKSME